MNIIDIIILIILAFAIFDGARNGLIIQGLSIVGIVLGIWLGTRFGDSVASLLGIGGDYVAIWGFIILLLASIIAVAIIGQLVRKLLQFVGFGLLDVILGAALSVFKFMLILSVIFTTFDMLNHAYNIVEHRRIEESRLYRPIANISTLVTPAWDWAQQQIDI